MVMDDVTRLKRLSYFNYLWLAIIVLGSLAWLIRWQWTSFWTHAERVRVSWEADGGISFSSMSDGPYVITNLIWVKSTAGRTEMSTAQLPQPVVIIESGRVSLSAQEVTKLVWYERSSRERVAAPAKGESIQALYYKAQKTEAVNP